MLKSKNIIFFAIIILFEEKFTCKKMLNVVKYKRLKTEVENLWHYALTILTEQSPCPTT